MAVQSSPSPADITIPDALPVLPLREAVVFPLTAVPLSAERASSIKLIDDVMRGTRLVALVTQKDPTTEVVTRRTSRSTTFLSSRTLPGHEYDISRPSAARESVRGSVPCCSAKTSR